MAMAERAARTKAPQPIDKYVGSRIRMRRHMLRLSQQSLGRAVGLTFQQIQKYENGTNRVGAGRLDQIAVVLGCQPEWFFAGRYRSVGNKAAAGRRVDADLSAFFADRRAASLVRGFVRLERPVQRALVALIAAACGRTAD